ncbi:MAG: ornithine carbamoyltransferase [Candidatus Omnitrophica bacterium]|nr:ornithine carbamoyltransferase [Candidatus Omnitrophota bacterium]
MKPRHLISIQDLSAQEIEALFRETAGLKKARGSSTALAGKTWGLLFEKPSVRTRVSFEVGIAQLGGRSLYIGPVELQNGKRESAKDVACVLSRYLDGIIARTFRHEDVVEMARWAVVPVVNGLSDVEHPCQALADGFTLWEKFGKVRGVRIAFVGDGNNVCHSLMLLAALLGAHLKLACPAGYGPRKDLLRWAKERAARSGGSILSTGSAGEAASDAQVVYTDVWASMGQEKERSKRGKIFAGYQVNAKLMKRAAPQALFMHCLPAHRGEEVTDEVMDSRHSIVYDQAENRLHAQKAVLLRWTARGGGKR